MTGLIPDASYDVVMRSPISLQGQRLFHTARHDNVLPVHSQGDLPSCVGHAWSNWLEDQVITLHGKAVFGTRGQIDGDAIWRRARELYYDNNMDDGITLKQGFQALQSLGLVPTSAVFRLAARDLSLCCEVLDHCPLVVGHYVWPQWSSASKTNGYIKPGPVGPEEPHAVVLNAVLNQNDEPYPMIINSWTRWGWHSLGCMSMGMWLASICSVPCYADLGSDWKTWRTWERYVIEV